MLLRDLMTGVGRARRGAAGAATDAPKPDLWTSPAHAAAKSKARTGLAAVTRDRPATSRRAGGSLHTRGPLGFVTHAVLVRPDGSEVEWSSRRHRKGLGLRLAGVPGRGRRGPAR